MHRFDALLQRANIELVDLPHDVELNGVLIYIGDFPNGEGRLMLNPAIAHKRNPHCIAVVAHELAHLLLSLCSSHPTRVLDYLLDRSQHARYQVYETEADCLAACLLVPPDLRASGVSPQRLAGQLGVPLAVVERALAHPEFDLQPVRDALERLTGWPDFYPYQRGLAAA
jgi:hypothetical protein